MKGKICQRKTEVQSLLIIGKTTADFQKYFNGLTKMKKLLYKLLAVFSQFQLLCQEAGKNTSNYMQTEKVW